MTEPKKIPSFQQNGDSVSSVKSGEQTVSCSPGPNNHPHHHHHPLHTTTTTATAHHDLNFNNGQRRSAPESNYTSPDQPDPDPEPGSLFEPDPDCSETKPLIPAAVSSVNEQTEENDDDDDEKKKKEAEFSFRTLSGTKKWTFVAMAFANFAACMAFSLLAPFFPREAKMKGASQTIIGLIFSTFELWIFVSSPIFGNYLTKIGSRFMFLAGMFTCGVCAILFGTLDKGPGGTTFIVMCFVVRSVEALGASAFVTASFAIIANEFPTHVSTVFGTLETFSGLGLMVGPPIGGFLYQLGGYGPPFYVMGVLLILCAVLVMLLLPIDLQQDISQPERGSILSLLTSPLVLVTSLTISSGSFALGFLDPTLASYLEQFGLNSGMVGLVFVVESAVYAITAPLWGYLSDTKGISFPLVIAGNIGGLVSYMLLGPSPLLPFLSHQLWLVIVALALMGLGVGCALACTLKCLLIGAREIGFKDSMDTFGLISGLFNSAFSFGTFLGPTVGSVVMDYYGFEWASTITAGCFALSLLVFGTYLAVAKKCRNCCVVTMPEIVGSESGVSFSPRRRLLSTGSISGGGGRERASSPSSPRQRLLSTESSVVAHVGASYNSMGSTAVVIMDNNVDSGNGDAQRV